MSVLTEGGLWQEAVAPGATWSHVLKRGTSLRITDPNGGANAGVLLLNFECPSERYNMPDTLKAQHTARLTTGHVLYSDMGRILCSITRDSVGWHDPIGGCSNASLVTAKYGDASYQEHHNARHVNARDGFLIELEKWGLERRDMPAVINFFSRVDTAEDGTLKARSGNSAPGSYVELRAEMNVLVVLNTCQHPLDPSPLYSPQPVHLSISRVAAPGPDDPCRISCPENTRGFILTERYFV